MAVNYRNFLCIACLAAAPAWSHHSDAGMDLDSVLAFDGTVTESSWRNPHVYVSVETDSDAGPVEWALQMGTTKKKRPVGRCVGWPRWLVGMGSWFSSATPAALKRSFPPA